MHEWVWPRNRHNFLTTLGSTGGSNCGEMTTKSMSLHGPASPLACEPNKTAREMAMPSPEAASIYSRMLFTIA